MLCGGMLVAMPTAMPEEPLARRFGKAAGSTTGSSRRAVIVRAEVDGVFVQALPAGPRQSRSHPRLGIARGGGVIAVDIAEVALPVDKRVADIEFLREARHGVIDRAVAVGVDSCPSRRLKSSPISGNRPSTTVSDSRHGVKDSPVNRLQTVPHIGQGAVHDGRKSIRQVSDRRLPGEAVRQGFCPRYWGRRRRHS